MKNYLTVNEIAESIGVSKSHAYKIIRALNAELAANEYITVAGRLPRKYFEKRWYGFESDGGENSEHKERS